MTGLDRHAASVVCQPEFHGQLDWGNGAGLLSWGVYILGWRGLLLFLRVVVPDYQCCHDERESAAAVQYN